MSAIDRGVAGVGLSIVMVAAACGAPPSVGSGATAAPTPTTAPTVAVAASPTPLASPTPRPTPLVSDKGTIVVKEPAKGMQLTSPVTISGEASVFEATLLYRIVTTGGSVLAQGMTTASAGAPQKGTFKVEVAFEAPYYAESGFVEVFERSPKDGSISDIVRVPVSITGSY